MKITGLPALSDNFIWVVQPSQPTSNEAWIVDGGEAKPVIDFFQKNQLQLVGILLTHHHYDHTDGLAEIQATLGKVPIISNRRGPYPHITHHVEEGDKVKVFEETFEVLAVPGHCQEHLAFYHPQALFCGDVLFTAGCGRSWTQPPHHMAQSLMKLNALDDDCTIYCGHDYTYGNINFAAIAEPNNDDIKARQQQVHQEDKLGLPSVPEKLGIEKKTNPFLRFNLDELKTTLLARDQQFYDYPQDSDANLYATLRSWKDALDKTGELETR